MARSTYQFNAQKWVPGQPITQDRMNEIEQELAQLSQWASADDTSITQLNSSLSDVDTLMTNISNIANQASTKAEAAATSAAEGHAAWTQLTNAGVTWTEENVSGKTLANLFEERDAAITDVETQATTNKNNITVLQNNVNGAKRQGVANDTLASRFADVENIAQANAGAIDTLNNASGSNYNTLAERLAAIDDNKLITTPLPNVSKEVADARGTDSNNDPYLTLSARLNAMDTATEAAQSTANAAVPKLKIRHVLDNTDNDTVLGADQGPAITAAIANARAGAEQTAQSYADTYKIAKTSIYNGLDKTADDGSVLDARQGKALKDAIDAAQGEINAAHYGTDGNTLDKRFDLIDGGSAPSRTLPDLIDEVETARDTYASVNARFEALESTDADVDTRIDAIDGGTTPSRTLPNLIDEVETARTSSIITDTHTEEEDGETITTQVPHTYDSIDARLEAIESHAAAVRTDVNTIAGELAMMDNNALVTTNTRVDTLENDLRTMARELDMLDGTAIVDTNTRIDGIESEINTAHRTSNDTLDARFDSIDSAISHAVDTQNSDPGGLTERLSAVETSITGNGGISDRLDALDDENTGAIKALQDADLLLDDRLDAIDGGSTFDDTNGTLVDHVEAIENAISHTAEGNDPGGLTEQLASAVATLANKANTADVTDALAQKANASDMATALAGKANANEVSLTIVKNAEDVAYENNGTPSEQQSWSIVDRNDYLLQGSDEKYYYWKHITTSGQGAWHLMGGAGGGGGTGNTSGFDLSSADYEAIAQSEDGYQENTDYYVTESDGVHHYRYVLIEDPETHEDVLTEIEIGTLIDKNKIKRYNIATVEEERTNTTSGEKETVTYLNLYQYDYDEANTAIDTERVPYARVELPKGGGGGAISTSVNKLIRIGAQNIQTITNTPIILRVFYSSWDDVESNDGTYVLKAGENVISSGTFNSGAKDEVVEGWQANRTGYYEFDVTNYCKIGNTNLSLTVSVNGTNLGKSWTVNIVDLHIESNAPDTLLVSTDTAYSFQYTPFGALTKTLHVLVDDVEIGTQSLLSATSGRSNSYSIPAQSHGAHTVKLYLTATIGNTPQTTDPIIREYIWYDANNTLVPVILASKYNGQTIDTQQYSTVEIPYQVYKKDAESIDVYYYLDNSPTPFDHVTLEGTNVGILSYLASAASTKNQNEEYIPHTITIKVDNVSITVNLIVKPLDIDVSPVNGAVIDFDPTSLTNSSANRLPSWTDGNETYRLTTSDNFNWSDDISGGGYKEDVDGKCFIVKAGSYVDLNYPMFKRVSGQTVLDRGAEMKIVFKVAAVRDVNAIWFNNVGTLTNKTVGIQLNAHNGWLKTDQATDKDVKDTEEEYPTWVENYGYDVDDVVVSKNVIYKCLVKDTNFTIIVPNDATMTKYWSELTLGTWTTGTDYKKNAAVSYDNKTYICLADIPDGDRAITPDTADNAYWSEFTATAWASGTEYLTGSIVTYNNTYYLAAKDVINELALNPKNNGNWLKMGATESEILATNSYLYFPYSEEDKIELDININAHQVGSDNNFIMSYEDGVPSKAYAYTYGLSGDSIYHDNTIRIGSPDCDVYIYRLRIYKNALETADILQNFIADGKDINEKVSRYNRNCIYWDDQQEQYFTSPSGTAILDPIKLAERLPNVKILMLDTPVFTVGKKNFVQGSTLRCIHAGMPQDYTGDLPYPTRGDADNWFFRGGFHAGQGTTSDNYGQSARNVDFLFEVDGIHYPTKSKNMKGYTPGNDYVSSVLVGKEASVWDSTTETWKMPEAQEWVANSSYVVNDVILVGNTLYKCTATHTSGAQFSAANWKNIGTISTCSDWKGDDCKIALTDTSVPNNYFNLKVNVASSENVNNALFQKRYNDFLEYTSPAHTNQMAKHGAAYRAMGLNPDEIQVKNGMEFVPAILFIRENDPDTNKHTEFNDCKWHFYALGNIGDSKKSDYTRAYDPDDMNEFTVENSDNNTNNGQFQSGVFEYNGQYAVETDYTAWDNTKAYKQNDIIVKDGLIYQRSAADMAALGENETATWTAADWTDITPTTTKTIYYAPRTNPNPMDYIYGIDPEEWNVKMTIPDGDGKYHYVNRKHETLVEEEFDGDHSFEFRYACCGDYRDGDLINDTTGKAKKQFNTNHDTVLAFYEWLVTSTDKQFEDEACEWIVPKAMEFFYAFTHYYTMMDNRAKNTFWHFAKTGEHYEVSRPVPELLHVYEEAEGTVTKDSKGVCTGTFSPTEDTEIISGKTYYTQYAFDLWVYDCDTAAGIDNNGALVFPYGKEDEDYRVEGESSSGYAFNGAGSIFWRRLKKTFADEITEVMNNADAACFNSEDLIDQFDDFQNCFPEEIWRLDIERKYIRTFTGVDVEHPYDNAVSVGKQNPRFLTSMMQGRKKYQRRQWIRDQGVYFNSKYRLTDIIKNDNTIEFNVITPTNASSLAVPPSYMLELTPYQDMYLNVQVGNGNYQEQKRAKAGRKYVYNLAEHTSGTFQETRIYINGANHLSKIGNLAPMYIYGTDFRALAHLKELDIGTDEDGFTNANLTELNFSSKVPLLETLNIKNCHSLAKPINLKNANNIRTVEAAGTAITGITLPDYTSIETLHLPSTVIAVSLYGARFLKDFKIYNNSGVEDYSNLYTLNIYDSDYSSRFTWVAENDYKVGDYAVIDNNIYSCIAAHTSVAAETKENTSDWNDYMTTNWTLIKANTILAVDWIDIALAMLEKQSLETKISLKKLSSATIGDIQTLAPMDSIKPRLEDAGGQLDLTGIIKVTGTYSTIEKTTYETEWPGLTLDVTNGTYQPKHRVQYIKADAVLNSENEYDKDDIYETLFINDGDPAPDIYSNGTLEVMPSKTDTPRVRYVFGSRNSRTGAYVPYSGWSMDGNNVALSSAPIITENTVLRVHFNEVLREYNIRWFLDDDKTKLIKDSAQTIPAETVQYGNTYTGDIPSVADIHAAGFESCSISLTGGQVTYSIFNGWNKIPATIDPDGSSNSFDIVANWNSNSTSIINLFNGITAETMQPQHWLVYSSLTESQKETYGLNNLLFSNSQVRYRLGYDSAEEGETIISENHPEYLDGTTSSAHTTNIQPLTEGNDAFTIALDFSLDELTYNRQFATIMSCYHSANNVISGIGIFYDTNTTRLYAGFGSMYANSSQRVAISYNDPTATTMRNIVIVRHPANSETLYIYASSGSAQSLPLNVFETSITRSGGVNFNSNAYLNFGQLFDANRETIQGSDGVLNDVAPAIGNIYWAKYWDKDLGQGECKRLACWPHEWMTFGIPYKYKDNNSSLISRRASSSVVPTPSVYLAALNLPMHGQIYSARKNSSYFVNNIYGWGEDNDIHNVMNKRIYAALPLQLQAITCKVNASYKAIRYDPNSINDYTIDPYALATNTSLSRDYIIGYSIANLEDSAGNYEAEDTVMNPFVWMDANQITLYNRSGAQGNWAAVTNGSSYYLNLRFPGKAIKWGAKSDGSTPDASMHVYLDSLASTSLSIAASIGTANLRSGDIYIDAANSMDPCAYIYVSNAEISMYGYTIIPDSETKFQGLSDRSVANIDSDSEGSGGWVKADSYWLRSAICNRNTGMNFAYVQKSDGQVKKDDSGNGIRKLNYFIAI